MTEAQIRAIIDDGPRRGDTVLLDPESGDRPPHEIMLPDGHAGSRGPGEHVPHPTKAVSRYRLVERGNGSEYHYRVVPHEQ
jgi:hypothetical protein